MADVEVIFSQPVLDELFESRSGPMAKALDERASRIALAAKNYAPVRTGFLRSSIYHELGVDGQGLFANVGARAHYAAFVEFGTRFMAAQPFLRPALFSGRF